MLHSCTHAATVGVKGLMLKGLSPRPFVYRGHIVDVVYCGTGSIQYIYCTLTVIRAPTRPAGVSDVISGVPRLLSDDVTRDVISGPYSTVR